jgi:predicted  nucleic acid-binding Zn ribbon protein
MTIKTWQQRCEAFDDMHITSHNDVQQAMVGEIADLRKELARHRRLLKRALDAIPWYTDGRHDKLTDAIERCLSYS